MKAPNIRMATMLYFLSGGQLRGSFGSSEGWGARMRVESFGACLRCRWEAEAEAAVVVVAWSSSRWTVPGTWGRTLSSRMPKVILPVC